MEWHEPLKDHDDALKNFSKSFFCISQMCKSQWRLSNVQTADLVRLEPPCHTNSHGQVAQKKDLCEPGFLHNKHFHLRQGKQKES